MNKKERIKFNKIVVKPIIREFLKLEKKYHPNNIRCAMRKYLFQVREEEKRVLKIVKLEDELDELKKKRL